MRRIVAVGSLMPCPTNVRISGNSAASPGSMIEDSTSVKRLKVPPGIGRVSAIGAASALAVNSSGACPSSACMAYSSSVATL